MTFSGLNFVGVLVAIVVSFISGGIWFGPKTFYPIWMKARGIESGQLTENQNKPAIMFGSTLLGIAVQTLVLGAIVATFQRYEPNFGLADGAGVGLALGVGVAAFASLSHRLFGGETFKV